MRHLAQSTIAFCRSHFFKIILSVLFFLVAAQYATNVMIRTVFYPENYSNNLSLVSTKDSTFSGSDNFVTSDNSPRVSGKPQANNSLLVTSTTDISDVNRTFRNSAVQNETVELPLCPLVPPKLVGPLKVLTEAPSFQELEELFVDLEPGGRFSPKECKSRSRVAIIVPYREREEHLRIFLHNLHYMLMRQQLDYGIYIVEEYGNTPFNRAMLMNVGYVEALKLYDYQCFIFHDVDLIPEDDRNIYSCPEQPRHMSVAVNTFQYRLPYTDIFGGVSALTREHMEMVNGFSNKFWGWGGEDDDMSNRVRSHNLQITRYPTNVARYTMLGHAKDQANPDRFKMLYSGNKRFQTDGLNSLKYKLHDVVLKKLYTLILAELFKD